MKIFCLAEDFCKYFSAELRKHQISDGKSIAISPHAFRMPKL